MYNYFPQNIKKKKSFQLNYSSCFPVLQRATGKIGIDGWEQVGLPFWANCAIEVMNRLGSSWSNLENSKEIRRNYCWSCYSTKLEHWNALEADNFRVRSQNEEMSLFQVFIALLYLVGGRGRLTFHNYLRINRDFCLRGIAFLKQAKV